MLERLIFNPTPDYSEILLREDTADAPADATDSLVSRIDAFVRIKTFQYLGYAGKVYDVHIFVLCEGNGGKNLWVLCRFFTMFWGKLSRSYIIHQPEKMMAEVEPFFL